jgi:hypothetical protein
VGNKGTTTQQGAQSYTANPAIAAAGNQALGMAQNAVQAPFSLPVQQYAGFNPQQQAGFDQTSQYAQAGQPYFQQAQGLFGQSAQPLYQQANNYLNPYAGYVMGNLAETQGQQMQDLTGRLTQQAGGVGGDRIAVGQAELARQQNLASGQTLAGIYGQALQGAQQGAQLQQSAGYGLGNLGATAQGAALQGAQANFGMGSAQQNLSQQQLNAQYANTLAQLAYPYQQAGFLANTTAGLAGAMGGTTMGYQQTTPPPPSIWSALGGLGTAGVGAAGLSGAFNGGNYSPSQIASIGNMDASSISDAQANAYGTAMGLAASGGRIGYDDGGPVKATDWMHADTYIPSGTMQPSQVHQPQLHFSNPSSGGGGGSSSIGSDISAAFKGAEAIAPFLAMASRGGAVDNPFEAYYAGGHYQSGGDVDVSFDDRFDPVYRPDDPRRAAGLEALKNDANGIRVSNEPVPLPRPRPDLPAPEGTEITSGPGSQEAPYRLDGKYQPSLLRADGTSMAAGPARVPITGGTKNPEEEEAPPFRPTAPDMSSTRQALNGPVPYPDLNQTTDKSRSFAKSPWLALMAAGFGMMGGTSPYAAVNIGKGALEGVKTLEEQRKELQSEEAVNQRARQLALEAQKHVDDFTKMRPYQQAEVDIAQKKLKQDQAKLEESGWQKGAENTITGDVTYFNPRSGESGILKADGTWIPKGGGGSAPVPPVPGASTNTPAPQQKAPIIAKADAPYGVSDLSSNLEPSQSNIPYIGKGSPLAQASTKDMQTTIMQQAKAGAAAPALAQDLAAMKLSFATLTKDADKDGFLSRLALQPGADFGDRLEKAKTANLAATAAGRPPPFDPEKVAAAENINKIQRRMGMTFTSQVNSREAFAGQKIGIESSPGLTNTPQGFRRLIAGFEAAGENAKDERAFFNEYIKKNGTSLGWRQDFEAKNPAERYLVRAMIGTLPKANQEHLAEDVETLRKDPSKKNIDLFNKHYADTASYFLTGRIQ